jgi:hypothetical protein
VGHEPFAGHQRSRTARTTRLLVVVAVLIAAAVVFVQARLVGTIVPSLDVSLAAADATTSGPLEADLVLENDGRYQVEVVRVVVHSDALGPSHIDVMEDGKEVRFPRTIDGGDAVTLHMTFDSFDCAQIADAPAIEVRAKPLVQISSKRGLDVDTVDDTGWLAAATAGSCQ